MKLRIRWHPRGSMTAVRLGEAWGCYCLRNDNRELLAYSEDYKKLFIYSTGLGRHSKWSLGNSPLHDELMDDRRPLATLKTTNGA